MLFFSCFDLKYQNDESDPDCIEEVCRLRGRPLVRVEGTKHVNVEFTNPNDCFEFDKVRVVRLDKSEAKGPVFARGLQPETVQDEDFCMQIDAHSIVINAWDLKILKEWSMTNNEFAVLSTYPTNWKDLDKNSNNHWEMPHLCGVSMSANGAISNHQASAAANLNKPLLAPLWAAGLSFSRCHAERDVPNDFNLKQIFSGEEFSRGARLWTHGYDFYSITRPTIGVYYGNDKGGRGGWQHNSKESQNSLQRLMTLLRMPNSDQSPEAVAALGKFSLGSSRTLEQYIDFTGVDTIHARAVKAKCIVKYVPWDDTGRREQIMEQEERIKRKVGTFQAQTVRVKSLGGDIASHVEVDDGLGDNSIDASTSVSTGHSVTWLIFAFVVLVGLKKFGSRGSKAFKSK